MALTEESKAWARSKRASMVKAGGMLTDEQAQEVPELYRVWVVGEAVVPGDIRRYNGKLYKVKDGMGHTTQADWTPDATPAMWAKITAETWEPWAPGSYPKGAQVTHNGKRYESQVDNNHYEPGSPGVYDNVWKLVT